MNSKKKIIIAIILLLLLIGVGIWLWSNIEVQPTEVIEYTQKKKYHKNK